MEEPKVHIGHVMLWEFKKKKKTPQKQQRKFMVFMAYVSLLTTKFETGFYSFILAIQHWVINRDQDAHQTSIKML